MALNGISMNLSRVVGPVVAGAIISAVGSGAVFVVNVLLASAAFATILRWRSEPRTSTLPGERFVGAMRVGWQHVMQSPRMKAVLVRIFFFFLQSSALLALLPLVARDLHGAGPGTYTLMLACIGGGAVVAALYFPRWRAALQPRPVRRHRHAGACRDVGDRRLRARTSGSRCRPSWCWAWPGSRSPIR